MYKRQAYGTTQVMYYNRSLFGKAGIRPDSIKTWEDLAEASEVIRQSTDGAEAGVYGWEPMWGEDNLIDMALSNGGAMLSDDNRTVLINSEPWIEAWEAVRKWIHEDDKMCIRDRHSAMQSKGAVSFLEICLLEICLLVIYFIFSYLRFHMCF